MKQSSAYRPCVMQPGRSIQIFWSSAMVGRLRNQTMRPMCSLIQMAWSASLVRLAWNDFLPKLQLPKTRAVLSRYIQVDNGVYIQCRARRVDLADPPRSALYAF